MKRNKWLLSLSIGLLCCGSAYAQTTVKGKITSEGGEPLIGATVAVKNSTDGTGRGCHLFLQKRMGTRHNRPERLWNSRKHSNRALAGNDYPHQWQQQRFHSFFLRISQRNVSRSLPPFRADLLPVHQRKTVLYTQGWKHRSNQRVNACHNSYIQRSWKPFPQPDRQKSSPVVYAGYLR